MTGRTSTEEAFVAAEPRNDVKTLGVKLKGELHAQFTLIAQLEGLSLADAVVQAVELYVTTKQSAADFQQRAAAVLAEIDREATARRSAIQALVGTDPAAEPEPPAKGRTRRSEGDTTA
jgi:hypothetical protein